MTQPNSPPPLPPPPPPTQIERLLAVFESLVEPVRQSNVLAAASAKRDEARSEQDAETARKLRRTSWLQVVAFIAVMGVQVYSGCSQAGRIADVTAKLEETTAKLDSLTASQDLTSRKVEDVKKDVQKVADSQPEVLLVDAGAGKPAKATIVVAKQAKPKPPSAPTVSAPLTVEDAGAP